MIPTTYRLHGRNYLRVRGEYRLPRLVPRLETELPPRARRILGCCDLSTHPRGTTSACAENTARKQNRV